MGPWCYVLACCLGAVVLFYALLELHYFLRMCLCVILARYVKKKVHILDTTTVSGICLTTDVDTLLYHMNNARYFRELDFARVDFYERTRLYRTIVTKGGAVVQGAATIRYRRFIRPFTRFTITSRIVYWDDKSVFMEHRFLSAKDNFIHAIVVCRQRVIDCSAEDVMKTLLTPKVTQLRSTTSGNIVSPTISMQNAGIDNVESGHISAKCNPEMPLEISKWMEFNEISSKNLRNGC